MIRFLRRGVKLVLVGALAALVGAWFRRRAGDLETPTTGSAEWPPLVTDPAPAPVTSTVQAAAAGSAVGAADHVWTEPLADGACPLSHPVKVKLRSGIYHEPDGLSYERTNADRCYTSAAAAQADGYRPAKL